MVVVLIAAVLLVAFANGANDNAKGIATLVGSRMGALKPALTWANLTTFLGSVAAIPMALYVNTELVKALVHITGGGLPENLPRVLPAGCGAVIHVGSWPVPPLFRLVTAVSALSIEELHRTLNMGVGMVVVCAAGDIDAVQELIDEATWVIGEITEQPGVVLA